MSLTVGTRLGLYEVIAKLGEGGMGEVYRARGTRRAAGVDAVGRTRVRRAVML